MSVSDGILATYHWEAEGDAHIFLYLTLAKTPGERFAIAQTNVDSEDVKGQGDAIWAFIGTTLQEFSDTGFLGHGPCPIVHEVTPNEYSRRLPDSDPRYVPTPDGTKYHAIFLPTTL